MSATGIVREMFEQGQRKWPSVQLSLTQFENHCESICDRAQLATLQAHAAELYLCCACTEQDPAALQLIEALAEPNLRRAIANVRPDDDFVSEALQELWKKLLTGPVPRIREYKARGPLQAWLRVAATRTAIDLQRAKYASESRHTDLCDLVVDQGLGPESSITRLRFFEPFRKALRQAVSELSLKERNVLRMHLQGHCSIDQIGRAYNVHRATAARWLEQVRASIVDSVRAQLRQSSPHLTDSEFISIARILGSELDLGLSSALNEGRNQKETRPR